MSLTLEGTYSDSINKSYFEDLFAESSNLGIKPLLTFTVLGENVDLDNFADECSYLLFRAILVPPSKKQAAR